MDKPTIISPSGFIIDTTPQFGWSAVDGATEYSIKITNNVTGVVDTDITISQTTYTPPTPLALGTYSWQVTATDGTDTSDPDMAFVIVTDTVASFTVTGRDGDKLYLQYKEYQSRLRHQAKAVGTTAQNILNTELAIVSVISNDPNLAQFHLDTIAQSPGLGDDLDTLRSLLTQLVDLIDTVKLRDPEFF